MEQKLVCDDRLDVARRLCDALCGQYADHRNFRAGNPAL
jgi:hypothetical protein